MNQVLLLVYFFSNTSCDVFVQELKKYGVTTVVRVCEATYDATLVVKEGIQVLVSSSLQTPSRRSSMHQTKLSVVFLPFFSSQLCVTFLNTPGQFHPYSVV